MLRSPLSRGYKLKPFVFHEYTFCLAKLSFLDKVIFTYEKQMNSTATSLWFQLKKRANLTKVLGRGAVITEDSDHARPEHLKGGNVGREDTKGAGECWDVNLFHTGLFEKHLQRERQHIHGEFSWCMCTRRRDVIQFP